MINSSGDYGDIAQNTAAITLLGTSFAFLGTASLTWLYFRLRYGPNAV